MPKAHKKGDQDKKCPDSRLEELGPECPQKFGGHSYQLKPGAEGDMLTAFNFFLDIIRNFGEVANFLFKG